MLCVVFVVVCLPSQTNGAHSDGYRQNDGPGAVQSRGGEQLAGNKNEIMELVKNVKALLRICSTMEHVRDEVDKGESTSSNETESSINETEFLNDETFGTKPEQKEMSEGLETEVNVLLTQKGQVDKNLVAELVKQFQESESDGSPTPDSNPSDRHVENEPTKNNGHGGHTEDSGLHTSKHKHHHHHTLVTDVVDHLDGMQALKRNDEESTFEPPVTENYTNENEVKLMGLLQKVVQQYRYVELVHFHRFECTFCVHV